VARIAAAVAESAASRPVDTFLPTARIDGDSDSDAIAVVAQHADITTLQLVNHVPVARLQRPGALRPLAKIVQVIHVSDGSSMAEALQAAPRVGVPLLDSGNPARALK